MLYLCSVVAPGTINQGGGTPFYLSARSNPVSYPAEKDDIAPPVLAVF